MNSGLWLFLSIGSVVATAFFIVLLITRHKYSMRQLELEEKRLGQKDVADLDGRVCALERKVAAQS